MADKHLTAKGIFQKEFQKSLRGYDPAEVNEFLDLVIRDYDSFQKEVLFLKEENERLIYKVDELTKQQDILKNKSPKQISPSTGVTNFDILKRLSNLEKHVFGDTKSDKDVDDQ